MAVVPETLRLLRPVKVSAAALPNTALPTTDKLLPPPDTGSLKVTVLPVGVEWVFKLPARFKVMAAPAPVRLVVIDRVPPKVTGLVKVTGAEAVLRAALI